VVLSHKFSFFDFFYAILIGLPYAGAELCLAFGLLVLMSAIAPRFTCRLSALLLPVGLLLCVGVNLDQWSDINGSSKYRLVRHEENTLLHIALKSPSGYARENLAPYFFIHDHLQNKTIVTYSKQVFDKYHISMNGRVKDYKVETYRYEITPEEAQSLMARKHTIMTLGSGNECVFVLGDDNPDTEDTYYILRNDNRHFVVPARLIPN